MKNDWKCKKSVQHACVAPTSLLLTELSPMNIFTLQVHWRSTTLKFCVDHLSADSPYPPVGPVVTESSPHILSFTPWSKKKKKKNTLQVNWRHQFGFLKVSVHLRRLMTSKTASSNPKRDIISINNRLKSSYFIQKMSFFSWETSTFIGQSFIWKEIWLLVIKAWSWTATCLD